MEIITRELSLTGIHIPEENASVVKRVIHATADFDFAKNLVFTNGRDSSHERGDRDTGSA